MITVAPNVIGIDSENTIGAAWYSGPVSRWASPLTYPATLAVADPGTDPEGRHTPLGWPVVPDVYNISPPGIGSAIGAPDWRLSSYW
ncbi:hypothetical protein H7J11_21240 [Mycobacterium bourgelatii]|nr:hypothetical protein [Mycobacterium bourgelatii]MCV6976990.1 hypothetical protein [Mycobacterium bourgelatii]